MNRTKLVHLIVMIAFLSITGSISAQVTAIDDLFEKYSGKENVSEIEMTQRMLKVVLKDKSATESIPIDRFKSFRIIANESGEPFNPGLALIKSTLEENDFERIAYLKERDEMVALYGLSTGKQLNSEDLFSKFILIGKEPNTKEMLMIIEGNLTLKEIFIITAMMNYDLSRILPF